MKQVFIDIWALGVGCGLGLAGAVYLISYGIARAISIFFIATK